MASFSDPRGQSGGLDLQTMSTALLLLAIFGGRGRKKNLLGTAAPFLLAPRELSFHLDARM